MTACELKKKHWDDAGFQAIKESFYFKDRGIE
jgi:hypothetical protein